MISGITKWTYALLAVSFALICVSAYVLVSRADMLASLRAELKANEDRVKSAQLDLAQRQSQLAVIQHALVANEGLLESLASTPTDVCPSDPEDRRELTTRELNLCELLRISSRPFLRFMGKYTAAAGLRAAGVNANDFSEVRRSYAALIPLAAQAEAGSAWLARVHEGIAYSEYRLGRLPEAEREIELAVRLDPGSGFARATALKIACSRGVADQALRERFRQATARLDASVKDAATQSARRLAELELRYLEDDPELAVVCADARIGNREDAAGSAETEAAPNG